MRLVIFFLGSIFVDILEMHLNIDIVSGHEWLVGFVFVWAIVFDIIEASK